MIIDPTVNLPAIAGVPQVAPTARPAIASGGFEQWFTQTVGQVNQQLVRVDADVRALATGQATSLHQVMIDVEGAKLSFELLAQVRNRLLESYQEVMRTQV